MKLIRLNNTRFAIVDDADFEWLNQWKWFYGGYGYATRNQHIGPDPDRKGKYISRGIAMHRLIMNSPEGMDIDHINRNRLDNRRCNLRIVTRGENNINQLAKKGNTSGHKGVGWDASRNKWRVQIKINGKNVGIGRYDKLQDAVDAYLSIAHQIYGEYLPVELR